MQGIERVQRSGLLFISVGYIYTPEPIVRPSLHLAVAKASKPDSSVSKYGGV